MEGRAYAGAFEFSDFFDGGSAGIPPDGRCVGDDGSD